MTEDDFLNNTPAKMEAYKRICEGVNEDQEAQLNLCGKPHNNGEDTCLECEVIKKGV